VALSTKSIAISLTASDAIHDRNGVVLVSHRSSAEPRYPYKALAAQTLGFVSAGTNEGHGVEGLLKGSPHADARLAIDARVQFIAENAMREAQISRGAVVVMDPRNGDVLALASLPGYDPNIIYGSPGNLKTLQKDRLSPLDNRALIAWTPGSIFKPVVALAGLASGKAMPETIFDCPASIPIGDHVFWNSDRAPSGRIGLGRAITVSSNVYFYQYGLLTGIDAIDEMGKRSGFGHKWNVLMGLDEDAGTLPGPGWMESNKTRLEEMHNATQWSNAHTANTAIGQGYVSASPLQVSAFTCAVANGGTVYVPRLVISPELGRGLKLKPSEGQVFGILGVKPSDLEAVQQAMLDVVKAPDGTARQAQIPGLDVAGKTGNAQVYRMVDGVVTPEVNAWFTCYAPFQNPRYVVTVLVNGGHWGGTTSAPIAKQILTQLFRMDQGHPVDLKPIEP
jgi:penicillin-binding protein 2